MLKALLFNTKDTCRAKYIFLLQTRNLEIVFHFHYRSILLIKAHQVEFKWSFFTFSFSIKCWQYIYHVVMYFTFKKLTAPDFFFYFVHFILVTIFQVSEYYLKAI